MEKPPACSLTGGPFDLKEGYALAWMLTNLPIRPRSLNSTTPVTLANRVSSLPQPTLVPGFSLVPRWRTMILPPGTNWPPKTFTPSRCAFESRPFLELPRPFLCAIRYLDHHFANLDFRVGLTVSDGFLVLFLALELEDQDLGSPVGADDGASHFAAGNQFAAFLERRLNGKLYFGADVAGQFFDTDHITGGYPILLSACLDDRVHANLRLGAGTHGVRRNHRSKEPKQSLPQVGAALPCIGFAMWIAPDDNGVLPCYRYRTATGEKQNAERKTEEAGKQARDRVVYTISASPVASW